MLFIHGRCFAVSSAAQHNLHVLVLERCRVSLSALSVLELERNLNINLIASDSLGLDALTLFTDCTIFGAASGQALISWLTS